MQQINSMLNFKEGEYVSFRALPDASDWRMGKRVFDAVASDASANPRTCIYLVREKIPVIYSSLRTNGADDFGLINTSVEDFSSRLLNYEGYNYVSVKNGAAIRFIGVIDKNAKDSQTYWGEIQPFKNKNGNKK